MFLKDSLDVQSPSYQLPPNLTSIYKQTGLSKSKDHQHQHLLAQKPHFRMVMPQTLMELGFEKQASSLFFSVPLFIYLLWIEAERRERDRQRDRKIQIHVLRHLRSFSPGGGDLWSPTPSLSIVACVFNQVYHHPTLQVSYYTNQLFSTNTVVLCSQRLHLVESMNSELKDLKE